MEFLKELMNKKKGGEMDPAYKDAKMNVLREIRDLAAGEMGKDVTGLKQVTVASPDKAGLAEGLDKAKELVGSGKISDGETHGDMADKLGDMIGDDEDAESPEMEKAEGPEGLTPEEEQLLMKLLAKKGK